jgi:hypothetical protein
MKTLFLPDGTPISTTGLSLQGRGVTLKPQRQRDIILGAQRCERHLLVTPRVAPFAIVALTMNGYLLGVGESETDVGKACERAAENAKIALELAQRVVPLSGVTAVVRPFPKRGLMSLIGCGVDITFSLEHLRNDTKFQEQDIVDGYTRGERLFLMYHYDPKES